MNFWNSLLLGVVQGLTEFLPISSSGHLVLVRSFFPEFVQPGVLFDVAIHLGTTLAVLIFYHKRIIEILSKNWNYIWLLIVGTVPAVIAGILFGDQLEKMFGDTQAIAIQFLITGAICILVDKFNGVKVKLDTKDSFLIGISQALAIVPAISRSGSTILAGSILGIQKEKVAEFSFLMSVPAIVGANVYEFIKHGTNVYSEWSNYAVGFVAAFIVGYLSIRVVLSTLHKNKFKYFGFYCLIVGLLSFIFIK